jgi:hypothetical protein
MVTSHFFSLSDSTRASSRDFKIFSALSIVISNSLDKSIAVSYNSPTTDIFLESAYFKILRIDT